MSTYEEGYNLQSFKISLLGDSGVGKTSIVNRYMSMINLKGIYFQHKVYAFFQNY